MPVEHFLASSLANMTATRATFVEDCANYEDGKVINDPFYGPMYFHPLIIAIIDTPEFQRLRYIKQLGATCYIYPGGIHTRFDHSLGTCHITGLVLKIIRERNRAVAPLLNEKTILSLEIAALCHDLGQGPFSKVYQDQFLSKIIGVDWDHNENSVKIFEIIWGQKEDIFIKYGIQRPDKDFITSAIRGEVPDNDKENRFLYEMVKNRRNGIDCNTFDKILRDCYFVGVKSSFNYMRIVENAKVCKVKGEYRLCLRFKEQLGVSALFDSSWALQSLVYTHKTTRAVEMMIAEAMAKVDDKFQFSLARNDPNIMLVLSDVFFHKILDAKDDDGQGLAEAKHILRRISQRKLYQFCGQTGAFPGECCYDNQRQRTGTVDRRTALARAAEDRRKRNELCSKVKSGILEREPIKIQLCEEDIRVEVIAILYGKGELDPLDTIDFVNKQGTLVERATASKCSKSLRNEYIRVYSRDATSKEKKREITKRFYHWCIEYNYDVPKDMEKVPIEHEFDLETLDLADDS